LSREKDYRIGATKELTVYGEHTHLFQSVGWRKVKSLLNPAFLQRLELETAAFKNALEAKGKVAAGAAIAVIKDPAAARWCLRAFCNFCQLRNHTAKIF